MKTVAEIDRHGNVVRIFHRTSTAAWDHLPGERYRYWGGRRGSGERWIEMPCPCAVSKVPRVGMARMDVDASGERPGPTARAQRGRQKAGA